MMLLTLVTCVLSLQFVSALDEGWELWFTSQPKTCQREPVFFEKPLPSWIKGTYIKNGFGQFEMGERRFRHLFDGYAKISAWSFENENETYFTSEFVNTKWYEQSKALNDIAPFMLFDSAIPPFSFSQKLQGFYNGIDNTNINIIRVAGDLGQEPTFIAMSDFWETYSFDLQTLKTLEHVVAAMPDETSTFSMIPKASTSHPLQEFGSNDIITFAGVANPLPFFSNSIKLIRIKSLYDRELITDIKVKDLPYMHSFAMSQNYAIIMDAPLYADFVALIKEGPLAGMKWHPETPLTMHVVELATGKTVDVKTDPVFAMHHVNSYEENNKLNIDYCVYPSYEAVESLRFENVLDPKTRNDVPINGFLLRFTIDLEDFSLQKTDFTTSVSFDMPAINEAYRFKKYCFVYGLSVKADGINYSYTALVRKNVCEPNEDKIWYVENNYPSEPWFVESPNATDEDDGLLFSIVLDGSNRESYLGVWDPKTMKLINKSKTPFHLPFPLHGRFYD